MFNSFTGLVLSFGILAYGVAAYLFSTIIYIDVTNNVEAKIANIEGDETIYSWEDIQNAKAHVRALRHKLKEMQSFLIIEARNKGLPPIIVGSLLAVWFFSKT